MLAVWPIVQVPPIIHSCEERGPRPASCSISSIISSIGRKVEAQRAGNVKVALWGRGRGRDCFSLSLALAACVSSQHAFPLLLERGTLTELFRGRVVLLGQLSDFSVHLGLWGF